MHGGGQWMVSEHSGSLRRFPMFTVLLQTLLSMTEIRSHEELFDRGELYNFIAEMGKAIFVSHQWASFSHPDPAAKQLGVLKKCLENLVSGQSKIHLPPVVELYGGRVKCPTTAFYQQSLYIWYDYFSVPQGTGIRATEKRALAIGSIPSYCAEADLFVILCPSIPHADLEGTVLGYNSWSDRGWCRLERMARALARDDGLVIRVDDADHPTLCGKEFLNQHKPPGRGQFTFDEDKTKISEVLVRMLEKKLLNYLDSKNFEKYRFWLSISHLYLDGLDVEPIEGLIPLEEPGGLNSFDSSDLTAKFLQLTRFKSISQRDSAGWSPLCYAAVKGDAVLVKALLNSRANVQDKATKEKSKAKSDAFLLAPNISVLSLASAVHSNEVVELLLSARANINAKDGFGGTALHAVSLTNNVEGARILCEARIDPNITCFPGLHPFATAAAWNSIGVMKVISSFFPVHFNQDQSFSSDFSLQFCLHVALEGSANASTISYLLDASADVNRQCRVTLKDTGWWLVQNIMSARHRLSPSALTRLFYHRGGSTPLMISLLVGNLEAASVLLHAGACLDLKNARGKTAADLVRDRSVSTSLSDLILSWETRETGETGTESEETVPVEDHQRPLASAVNSGKHWYHAAKRSGRSDAKLFFLKFFQKVFTSHNLFIPPGCRLSSMLKPRQKMELSCWRKKADKVIAVIICDFAWYQIYQTVISDMSLLNTNHARSKCGLGITTMWSPEKPAGSVPDSAVDHHGQSGSHWRVEFKILLKIIALPNLSINFAILSQWTV